MSQRAKKILCPSIALALAVLATVVVLARNEAVTGKSQPAEATQGDGSRFKQTIRVWVHDNDIRPKIIRGWPGRSLMVVENETQKDISLRIDRVTPNGSQPLNTLNGSARAKRKSQQVTLAAGEYELYESSRPDIKSRLIVEPRK